MIWSVSRFGWSIGMATASSVVKASMAMPPRPALADVGEVAGDGSSHRHRRAEQMRAHARPLAADEVAVRGRGDALACGLPVSPFMPTHIEQPGSRHSKPASTEDLVEPFRLGLLLDQTGACHDPRRDHDLAALGDLGRGAQILDAAVGAGADEDAIDRRPARAACRAPGPYSRARASCCPSWRHPAPSRVRGRGR